MRGAAVLRGGSAGAGFFSALGWEGWDGVDFLAFSCRAIDRCETDRGQWLMSTRRAVVLEPAGPPEALQIRNLTILVLTPAEVLIRIANFGLKWSEV